MKCPKCNGQHKRRSGMRCHCGYTFALDPKVDGMADRRMLAIIRKASAGDTQYFTFNQLVTAAYALNRKHLTRFRYCLVVLIVVSVLAWLYTKPALICISGLWLLMLLSWITSRLFGTPKVKRLRNCLTKWERRHGPIECLLRGDQPLAMPPPEWSEADLYDYGVERIVIVEKDLYVDLLVYNDFHSDQRALVLSESGYPDYVLPHARKIISGQQHVPVFLLHDATPTGVKMKDRVLTNPAWSIDAERITDLGLFPRDVQNMPGMKRNSARRAPALDVLAFGALNLGVTGAVLGHMTFAEMIQQNRENTSTEHHSFG